jgi:tetratricopeptide (TPR) repeat protein
MFLRSDVHKSHPKIIEICLIFVLSLLVYANTCFNDFIWDDEVAVQKNLSIRSLGNCAKFFTHPESVALNSLSCEIYRPLRTLSFAIDFKLDGDNPFIYHFTNIFLHGLVCILIYYLVILLINSFFQVNFLPSDENIGKISHKFFNSFDKRSIPFVTALIFALHPIHTESVAWICGRADILSFMFFILSLIFMIKDGLFHSGKGRPLYFCLGITAYLLALFSKEMVITLPIILILYEIIFRHKLGSQYIKIRILRYLPFFIIAVWYFIIRGIILGRVSQCLYWEGSAYRTFLAMTHVIIRYLKLIIIPFNLSVDHYNYIKVPFGLGLYEILNILLIIGTIFISFVFLIKKKQSLFTFGIFWFFIILLPVMNIIPIKALIAERFLYIPSLGLCLIIAVLLTKLRPKILFIGVLLALLFFYFLITFNRNRDWQNRQTLWQATLKTNPKSCLALVNMASVYADKEEYSQALEFCQKAVKLDPKYFPAYITMGNAYFGLRKYDIALKLYQKANSFPDVPARYHCRLYNYISIILIFQKKYDQAIKICEKGLRFKCYYPALYLTLARAYSNKKMLDKALYYYKIAIDKNLEYRKSPIIYNEIAELYAKKKEMPNAFKYWQKALEFDPDYKPAKEGLKNSGVRSQ